METINSIKRGLKYGTISKSGISPDYSSPGTYTGYWKFVFDTGRLSICPRAKKLAELKADGVSPRNVLRLLQPAQAARLIREFKYACDNNCNFEIQVKIATPGGKVKWVRIAGVLHYRRWGTAEQMVGIIEDTTQKICEGGLGMAVVNHELRSPLTIIKLNVQLLINMLSAGHDKYPVKLLNNVDQHINFMTKLMDDYLVSSLDEKRIPQNNFTVFDLNGLVDTVVNEMKTLYTGNRFRKQPAMPVWVRADKYKIIQVLINYFTNAVNFSPPMSLISICTTLKNSYVEVSIHDQGIGVPAGKEQDIFQRFYKCGQKDVRHHNSKGLGLYLVKNIIREHGGAVRAEKGADCGSVFYFSLPLHRCGRYEQAATTV